MILFFSLLVFLPVIHGNSSVVKEPVKKTDWMAKSTKIYTKPTVSHIYKGNKPSFISTSIALGASIVPGLLISGSGHYVGGDLQGSKKLLLLEGVGLATFIAGAIPFWLTNSSRKMIGIPFTGVIMGGGLFLLSKYADIFGVLTYGQYKGSPPILTYPYLLKVGYQYVYDPLFDYSSFAYLSGTFTYNRFSFSPSTWLALDDNNQKVRVEASYRFLKKESSSGDGSFAAISTATSFHRYGTEGFSVLTLEAYLYGRYDLKNFHQTMKGAFFQTGAGYGNEFTKYPNMESRFDGFSETLLLGSFSFGIYLGRGKGEVELYYDHRHDDFTGGLRFRISGDGVAGYVGVRGYYEIFKNVALYWNSSYGSNFVFQTGVQIGGGKNVEN